jgi:hypothetical protein
MVPSSATCATTMRSLLDTGVIKAELSELSAPLKFHQLADAPDPRTRYRPAPVPPSSHSPNSALSEPETSTGTPFPVMVACREPACPGHAAGSGSVTQFLLRRYLSFCRGERKWRRVSVVSDDVLLERAAATIRGDYHRPGDRFRAVVVGLPGHRRRSRGERRHQAGWVAGVDTRCHTFGVA